MGKNIFAPCICQAFQKKYTAMDTNVKIHLQGALRIYKIISLKVGAPVILVKNVNIKNGLVNGAHGIVKELKEKSLIIQFPSSCYKVFLVYNTLQKKTLFSHCKRRWTILRELSSPYSIIMKQSIQS